MVRFPFPKLELRGYLLLLAIGGWLSGFWWCRGRWEQGLWFQVVMLPVFAVHADRVWALWKDWHREMDWRWLGMFAVIEWQFWVTGIRTGDWWGGAGSGKDLIVLIVVISLLVLAAQSKVLSRWLQWGTFAVASVAIAVSLLIFYQDYGLSENRFRLVWRYAEGFNAVTTGLLVGFPIVLGLMRMPLSRWLWPVFAVLGFALAGSESRGALLAVLAAGGVQVAGEGMRLRKKILRSPLVPAIASVALGFGLYWGGVSLFAEEGGALVARGSAGRLDIYRTYLDRMQPSDWLFGRGEVVPLGAEVMGWTVHHCHSAYLGQLVAYGTVGLLGLVSVLGVMGWALRRSAFFPLIVFGAVACLFDGGTAFSALSMARWEVLVLVVPLVWGWTDYKERLRL